MSILSKMVMYNRRPAKIRKIRPRSLAVCHGMSCAAARLQGAAEPPAHLEPRARQPPPPPKDQEPESEPEPLPTAQTAHQQRQQPQQQQQCGPGFLIIGAGRSATSSLYRYLLAHPQVVGARQKQLQFWGAVFAVAADQTRSLERYVKHGFPDCDCDCRVSQLSLTDSWPAGLRPSCTGNVMAGEASPSYLADPRVPVQLEQHMPGVKILVVLRDPATRCFSSYRHNYLSRLERGASPIPFETMARWEIERVLDPCLRRHRRLAMESSAKQEQPIELPECYRAVAVEEQFKEVYAEAGQGWTRQSLPRHQQTVYRSMVGRSL